jgi:hypothetical protein
VAHCSVVVTAVQHYIQPAFRGGSTIGSMTVEFRDVHRRRNDFDRQVPATSTAARIGEFAWVRRQKSAPFLVVKRSPANTKNDNSYA